MLVELIISKDRVSYIVNALGEDRVKISEYNEEQELINFKVDSQMDLLYMFHAGISCGSDSMAKALL